MTGVRFFWLRCDGKTVQEVKIDDVGKYFKRKHIILVYSKGIIFTTHHRFPVKQLRVVLDLLKPKKEPAKT